MKNNWLIVFVLSFLQMSLQSYSADLPDYLVLQDIGPYKPAKPEKLFPGEPPAGGPRISDRSGIIGATGHFSDHTDRTYEIMYLGKTDNLPSPTVQVTQHAGGDSDKWLLHEVEDGFRKDKELNAIYISPNPMKEVDGNKIFFTWGYYRWLSTNIVISIQFTDPTGTGPEPLEVVRTYLAKYPSTIPSTFILNQSHSEQWIKDEMARRLWLGDKWFLQVQTGKVETDKVLKEAVDHMNLFLDYRQKYYGVAAQEEKQALFGFLQAKDGTSIKKKLAEYKSWWEANKARAINLS